MHSSHVLLAVSMAPRVLVHDGLLRSGQRQELRGREGGRGVQNIRYIVTKRYGR